MKHRQMWVGTLLGVVMGVGLYAMSFTLPVFLQNNLHMTAEQTGIVLLPGALATARVDGGGRPAQQPRSTRAS